MEKINDIISNIRERFANPLVFSFLCSWVVLNWKISVGLLWYDPTQLEKHGYVSFFELIENNLNPLNSIYKPLIFAIIYTIFAPILKNLVRAFYSWTTKWGETLNLKIVGGGSVSINKYLQLRDNYKNNLIKLTEVIQEESEYVDQNNVLQQNINELNIEINRLKKKLIDADQSIQESEDVNILFGTWICNYELVTGQKGSEEVAIRDGKYLIITNFDNQIQKFNIIDFHYNKEKKSVFFIKELVNEEKKLRDKSEFYNINRLHFKRPDLLVGYENGNTKIEYKKKQ